MPDEFVQVTEALMAESAMPVVVWYWPPHAATYSSASSLREDLAPENASRLLLGNASLDISDITKHELNLGELGVVLVDVPKIVNGSLTLCLFRVQSSFLDDELGIMIPNERGVELFNNVTRPFKRIRKRPLYFRGSGRVCAAGGYTQGVVDWVNSGGILVQDSSLPKPEFAINRDP